MDKNIDINNLHLKNVKIITYEISDETNLLTKAINFAKKNEIKVNNQIIYFEYKDMTTNLSKRKCEFIIEDDTDRMVAGTKQQSEFSLLNLTELNSNIKFEKTTIEKLIESNPSIIIGDIIFHYLPHGIKTTKKEFKRYVKVFAKD